MCGQCVWCERKDSNDGDHVTASGPDQQSLEIAGMGDERVKSANVVSQLTKDIIEITVCFLVQSSFQPPDIHVSSC